MRSKRGAYHHAPTLSGKTIARVVLDWRQANGITQAALAEAAKMRQGYVSKIEKGDSGQMRLETAAKICIGAADLCKRPIGGRLELETLLSPDLAAEYRRKVLKDGKKGKSGQGRKRKNSGTEAVPA